MYLTWMIVFSVIANAQTDMGWPHIRGSNYDGVSTETNLADTWPASGPPVLWVKELGQGYSSIVTQHERVYTQYQTLAGQFVLCLDANTGETVWSYRYDWPFEMTGLYPGPFSTPTLAEGHVYFTTPAGGVGCLTLSGKLIWSRELKKEFDGKGTDFGYACSPTVVDGKVILPVGGRDASLVALNATDGKLVWKSGDEPASYTPVLPITIDGQQQVIGYLEHDLIACDLMTGKQLWKQTLSSGYDEHSAWPIYREPHLWTSAPFQAGSRLWQLSGGENAACQEVRYSKLMSNDVASSVLVDGTLYGFDLVEAQSKAHRPSRGSFRAIDWLTGAERWSNGDSKSRRSTDYETNKTQQVVGHASVLAADGKLLLLSDLGDLILVQATPERYVELARTQVLGGEISWASPALDKGRLFLRNQSRIVCLDIGIHDPAERLLSTNQMTVADLPQGEILDFAALIGIEPEYAMDPPTWRWLWQWYLCGAAILNVAALVVIVIRVFFRRLTAKTSRLIFCLVVFLLGIVVGPIASLMLGDFAFTWPVCLFVTFSATIHRCQLRRRPKNAEADPQANANRAVAIGFLATCSLYFVVCRRLSLVTQWTFLWGFPAAIPVLLLDRYLISRAKANIRSTWISLTASWLLTQIAFALYFSMTACLLSLRYELERR